MVLSKIAGKKYILQIGSLEGINLICFLVLCQFLHVAATLVADLSG